MKMPTPDESAISRRTEIAAGLREIVGEAYVMADDASLKTYENDALRACHMCRVLRCVA